MKRANGYILILLIPLLLIAVAGYRKAAFFIDEYLSYELANHKNNGYFYVDFEDGREYTGDEAFLNSVLPESNSRFDYKNVWQNQANDVHPPFYYYLLHTICSMTPGLFSRWQGILLNILWGGVLLFFLYRLIFKLTGSDKAGLFISLGYGLTKSFLDCGILIRMYMMLCADVVILSYLLFLLLFDKEIRKKPLLYLLIFFATVTGTLTQYYFLIYLFFIAASTALILLFKKRYKELIAFAITQCAAGVAAFLMFRPMIFHIFKGYRGKQSFENLVVLNNVLSRLRSYGKFLLSGSFSIFVIPVIAITVILIFFDIFWRRKKIDSRLMRLIPFIVSSVCYICVVAKTSPLTAFRYIWCVCPILFACIFSAFYIMAEESNLPKIIKTMITPIAVICGCITLMSGLEYDYDEYRPTIRNVAEYADRELIYIYSPEMFYSTVKSYPAVRDYSSVRYYSSEGLQAEKLPLDSDEKVVIIQDAVLDSEELLEKICFDGGYGNIEKLTINNKDFGVTTWLISR